MKPTFKSASRHRRKLATSGYTLVEVAFVSFIMVIIVMALLAAQLVGFRIGQLVDSKSGASDSSRLALIKMATDIRSAKLWAIGNLSGGTNFIAITNGVLQGPALQLCQSNNTSAFTVYYFTSTLDNNGATNGVLNQAKVPGWQTTVICSNLIDNLFFTSENYAGVAQSVTLTNVNNYKNVVHVILDFCQFQYPLTQVGTNGLYDFYKLEFRATPHLPE
jgi:hypothetical protein